MAKTVCEARRLGVSTGHIKYDLSKGHAKLLGATAVVCFGPSYTLSDFEKQDPEAALAAPLLEAWCDEKYFLGEIGTDLNRDIFRSQEKDDLSIPDTVKKAHLIIRQHPGCHLQSPLSCTPWSSWQRVNFAHATEAGRERVRRARKHCLKWAATFRRLARSALAGGDSVSFEWSRYCEGWKQPLIVDMLRDFDLYAVPVEGCATGLTDKNGIPLFSPGSSPSRALRSSRS